MKDHIKQKNILIYEISFKTFIGSISLHIRFNKIDGFIKIYEIRYLVLLDYRWCDKICCRIKHLISEKCGITDSIKQNSGRIRIDSYNSLPIENILTFHNVIILIKSVVNKNRKHYY